MKKKLQVTNDRLGRSLNPVSSFLTKPKVNKKGYAAWFLYLWGVIMVALLVLLFFIPFTVWSILAVVFFGSMETVGVVTEKVMTDSPYPPLTQVLHTYLRDWMTLPAISAVAVAAGAKWHVGSHPWGLVVLAGLIGWLWIHFISTYYKRP